MTGLAVGRGLGGGGFPAGAPTCGRDVPGADWATSTSQRQAVVGWSNPPQSRQELPLRACAVKIRAYKGRSRVAQSAVGQPAYFKRKALS